MWSSALKSFSSNISSNYKISDQPTSSAGPWDIFDAKHKSSGKIVSVFVFSKKSLEPSSGSLGGRSGAGTLKRAHEEVVDRLKREASSLARLRHPSILELVEPVEETRNGGLTFATEQVTASLDGLLRDKDEQERAGGVGGRSSRYVVDEADGRGKRRREIEIDQLEIQKGLLQIGQGLEFLHESAGLVHANLTPEAIFVNAKSDWKISGLGFSGKSENANNASTAPEIPLAELLNYDPRLPRSVQLNLDYSSPDFVLDNSVTSSADMFSLGLLIVSLFNSPHKSPLETNQSVSSYKRTFASSSTTPSQSNNFLSSTALNRDVSALLPRLLTRRPAQRMNAKDFQNAQFFDNILVSTIRFLESMPAKTPNEKSMFLRGLPRILPQFPKSVLEKKVLPALLEEMKDKELIALVLQNVFKMIKQMSSGRRAFSEKIIPRLREIFLNTAGTKGAAVAPTPEKDSAKAAGLMILLENISVIAENTNGKEFEQDVWPIIRMSMESPAHALVDASLRTLSVMLSVLDYPTIKNDVFPVISTVFSKTNSLGIKIRGLEALQTLCGGTPGQDDFASDGLDGLPGTDASKQKPKSVILDKYTIQEKVVPLLKAIKTKEPAVMMAALEVFKEIGKICDADYLALEALPILWSFSLGPLLNLPQFQSFMSLIQTYSQRIVSEQTRKLQELSATQPPIANRNDFMTFARVSTPNGLDSGATVSEGDFESLVLGRMEPKNLSTDVGDAFDGWTSSQPRTSTITSQPTAAAPQAPAFSWSTPTSTPAPTTLRAPTQNLSSFRAVTPDQSLNAFSTLQPTTSAYQQPMQPAAPIGFTQPLQPSNSAFSSTSTPTNFANQPMQPSSQSVKWGTSPPTLSSTNIWATPQAQTQTPMSGWTTAQPQMNTMIPSRPAQQQQGSFGIPPPPSTSSPYSSFGIAPPPPGGISRQGSYNTGMAAQTNGMQQQQQQQRQQLQQQQPQGSGLDKYESLL